MTLRAAIFDVYGTLLEVGPPPLRADEQWRELWQQALGIEPRLSRLEFSVACSRVIGREHASAKARGIMYPEINWESIVTAVVPELGGMTPAAREEFLLRQMRTGHTTRLAGEAAEALSLIRQRGGLLGLASNAQGYTRRELEEGLTGCGLGLDAFEPDLCFWSYQHGFSKPDPHVFRLLSARLELRGVGRGQTLMVGDRADHDIEPARRHGWQTWQLGLPGQSGGWKDFLAWLKQSWRPV